MNVIYRVIFKTTFNVENQKVFRTNDEIVIKLVHQIVRNILNGTFYREKAQSSLFGIQFAESGRILTFHDLRARAKNYNV